MLNNPLIIKNIISNSGIDSLDTELIVAFVLNRNRAYVVANQELEINRHLFKNISDLFQRRKNGEPLAYILNKKEFYSNEFYVDKNVLIPRPETETIVEIGKREVKIKREKVKSNEKNIRIIDVGCGSGCIGISLVNLFKNNFPIEIIFSDISFKALEVARKNYDKIIGKNNFINAKFIQSDLFYEIKGNFDIILSNPPYIPDKNIPNLQTEIKDFEPFVALSGGDDGLDIINRLIKQGIEKLNNRGVFVFEFHEDHKEKIGEILKDYEDKIHYEFVKDLGGVERFVKIRNME